MELVIVEDYAKVSRAAADRAGAVVSAKPNATIIVATGDTPMGMYRELEYDAAAGKLDTARLRVFQLDAYLGISADDPRSLYQWMERTFLAPLRIPPEHVVRLPGDTVDPEGTCRAFDAALSAAGGLDLAILGLGPNGHLGFNEPPSGPETTTRVVDLSAESIESGARYWGSPEQVPHRALTAGMAQLLSARHILLLVSGTRKRDILRATVEGPVTPDIPASFLQATSQSTIICDREAAASLTRA